MFGPLYHLALTCVYASVVLQVSCGGELLAAVLLLADEGLLAVVSPHVNLQPLQHVEALPAAFCPAPEHSIIPRSEDKQTSLRVSGAHVSFAAAHRRVTLGDHK